MMWPMPGWLAGNTEGLVTSDHVLVELFTLLKARGQYRIALEVGDEMWSGKLARIEPVSSVDLMSAWIIFKRFDDKRWSFVDCISRVVMERLDIKKAFTFDEHFRQFGTVTVVP
jgi:uncharacterized protein